MEWEWDLDLLAFLLLPYYIPVPSTHSGMYLTRTERHRYCSDLEFYFFLLFSLSPLFHSKPHWVSSLVMLYILNNMIS